MLANGTHTRVSPRARLIARTCRFFGVTRDELFERTHNRRAVLARDFYCFWARRILGGSFRQIADGFGGCTKQAVIYRARRWPRARREARDLLACDGWRIRRGRRGGIGAVRPSIQERKRHGH